MNTDKTKLETLQERKARKKVKKLSLNLPVSRQLVCSWKTCNEPVWLYGCCVNHLLVEWS